MLNPPQTSELRPEIVRDFPHGGAVMYHTGPAGKNLKTLSILESKHLITLRHPMDQLAAACCHYRGSAPRDQSFPWAMDGDRCDVMPTFIAPIAKDLFEPSQPYAVGLSHLINEGYLDALLRFAGGWSRFRHPDRGMIVRYEDLVTKPYRTMESIAEFLDASELPKQTYERLDETYLQSTPDDVDEAKYPHGWTGRVGTSADYFSAEHREAYRARVEAFERVNPLAEPLLDLYPNLMEAPSP